MIPFNAQRFVDWEQTRTEQGSWPTETMVSLWFKSDTHLATMVKDEVSEKLYKFHEQLVKARRRVQNQRDLWQMAL